MDWEAEWISTAERLVRNAFKESYTAIESIDNPEDTANNSGEHANKKTNIFDSLPALAPPKASDLGSELNRYLSTDVEHVTDAITWWHERRHIYPSLSRMAVDYLTIPGKIFLSSCILLTRYRILATSVDVERLFSRGRLLLSHIRSRLSVQSTRALLCLGVWSKLNLVKNDDVKKVVEQPEVGEHDTLEGGWDLITPY